MGIYVNTNINSLIAQRSLTSATSNMQNAITRLSTGLRVNHAGDDAAGLCVAQGLETLIRGNSRAKLNIQDGLNMMYIAEGGMEGVTEDLQRIRELCVQVASDIYSPEQKQTLMNEIQQRLEDIDVIANTTSFNGVVLTNGTNPEKMTIQSGSGWDEVNNSIDIAPALTNMLTSVLGVKLNIVSIDEAVDTTVSVGNMTYTEGGVAGTKINGSNWDSDMVRDYIRKLDDAINLIAENRSSLGAYQNRLTSASNNLTIMNENYEQSKSQIMDADMAEESANMVKYQVLQQTSATMLAQANQIPSIALTLLGG